VTGRVFSYGFGFYREDIVRFFPSFDPAPQAGSIPGVPAHISYLRRMGFEETGRTGPLIESQKKV
jgi:hypothetical protein